MHTEPLCMQAHRKLEQHSMELIPQPKAADPTIFLMLKLVPGENIQWHWAQVIPRVSGIMGCDSIMWSVVLCGPYPTLTVMYCETDYHQNLIFTALAHVTSFHQILRKSTESFLYNPADKQSGNNLIGRDNKLCGRPPQYAPAPCKLTFDFLTLKVVSESCVTWPTSMPILVFLGLSILDLGLMYVTDRRQTCIIA